MADTIYVLPDGRVVTLPDPSLDTVTAFPGGFVVTGLFTAPPISGQGMRTKVQVSMSTTGVTPIAYPTKAQIEVVGKFNAISPIPASFKSEARSYMKAAPAGYSSEVIVACVIT